MAIFNEIEQVRVARFLQKYFGIRGSAPVRQLAGEVAPVFEIFNGAENRYLEGWNRFAYSQTVTAVAAINSTLRIRNPTTNIIAVLEKVTIATPGGADIVNLGVVDTSADLVVTATGINNRLDKRQGLLAPGNVLIISNSDATHPGSLILTMRGGTGAANAAYDFISTVDQEIPILPGGAIDVWGNTVNVADVITYQWRERILEDAETR